MKKQLLVDDMTLIVQWVGTLLLTPFILLPLFPREPVAFATRLWIIIGVYAGTGLFTLYYAWVRRQSKHKAAFAINILALFDVVFVTLCLVFWPSFIPDLFWIFPVMIIVVGTRYGYRETTIATLFLSLIYAATIFARLGNPYPPDLPVRTILGDTLVKIAFMWLVAIETVYITQRERRERDEASVLSKVAAAIGSTLNTEELMKTVVEGISEAAGLGRCSAYLLSADGQYAVPQSTTEDDQELRKKFFEMKISLRKENLAKSVVEQRRPIIVTDIRQSRLVDKSWVKEFGGGGAVLALPLMLRDEPRGIVMVERRGHKDFFMDREVEICNLILSQASAGLENSIRYVEEQQKRTESDILYRSSRELGSTLDVEQVAENACKIAIHSTGASACTAFLADERRGVLVPRVTIGGGDVRRSEFPDGSDMRIEDTEAMFSLAQRPPALLMSNPEEISGLPPFLRAEDVVLLVPFYAHGRLAGLLCVSDSEGREFTNAQMTQLAAVAGEASLAVLNARLYERIRLDAAQLSSLVQLANAIGSTADLHAIMRIALDTVRHMFDCKAGLIYRVDEHRGTLHYVESFGYPKDVIDALSTEPFQPVGDCWTFVEGRLVAVDDISRSKPMCLTLEKVESGSAICVVMQVEGRILGILHIRSDRPGAFSEEDQQLVMAIADQVALAVQRGLLFEEINRLAITDPLTGVYNVRRLESMLQDEISRARRYSRPISFLMIDVDNLKSYNDTLGHQRGDVTLSQIASILDTQTREVDKVFRYGGDEFCVILPETDSPEATIVAEKVRRSVSEFHFSGEDKIPGPGITISVGIATYPKDSSEEEGLIRKADEALYAAKQKGRNTIAASR